MKITYKCSNCESWFDEEDIDHIACSSGEGGQILVWIECKKCKEKYNGKEKTN